MKVAHKDNQGKNTTQQLSILSNYWHH